MISNRWVVNCWLVVAAGNPASAAIKPTRERRAGRSLGEDTTSVILTTSQWDSVYHYPPVMYDKTRGTKGLSKQSQMIHLLSGREHLKQPLWLYCCVLHQHGTLLPLP